MSLIAAKEHQKWFSSSCQLAKTLHGIKSYHVTRISKANQYFSDRQANIFQLPLRSDRLMRPGDLFFQMAVPKVQPGAGGDTVEGCHCWFRPEHGRVAVEREFGRNG